MTNIFIIRHAEVEYSYDSQGRKLMYRPETHISQDGRAQITTFAEMLKERGVRFDRIETSPFTRALETAQMLAKVLGTKEIVPNPAFSDSHMPGWFDLPLSEQQKVMDKGEDIYMNPRSEDQEKYEDVAKRMHEGFKRLTERSEGQTVALVSHGDPIRLLIYRLEHPEGKIPNMSILSKEGYLKRGEAFRVSVDQNGNILDTELIKVREGAPGERELYTDNPSSPVDKK